MQQLVDNRYRLVRPLGSGGMADVFLAHDAVLDRDVALKVMSTRYASDDEFVERFKREAQSAAALAHPNIVSIYDRGESDDGTYYIAMEYLPGGTLKDRILSRGALPPRTAAAVALQIAEALKVAHDRGVVHRDIKPHNILITGSGDVKVTDFGIARAASSSTMTRTGHILGTAHYISPEQAMGEPVGSASDLYSLGIVLYEMLTGELPFDADTPIGIAMKHVNGLLRPPKELNPNIPDGINAVTVRLLAKDPDDRYASDAELIEDLERVSAGLEPSGATTEMMTTGATRAMPAGGAIGAAAAARTAQITRKTPTRAVPPPRAGKKRRRLAPLLLASLALLLLASLAWAGYNYLQAPQEATRQILDVSGDSPGDAPKARVLQVPNLVGMTLDGARSEVGDDFEVVEGDSRDGARPAGTILDQQPQGGTAEDGSEITVTVASGRNEVPDVTGEPRAQAQGTLKDAGFDVQTRREESSAAQEGLVTGQDPAAGVFGGTAEVGSTVDIVVGSGPGAVSVPNLYGYTASQAEAVLADRGLELGAVSKDYSADASEGSIFYQSPANGASVERGSAVDVTVSLGPEQITIPDVYGMAPEEAQATLEAAGLSVNRDYARVPSEEAYDTIIYTDPQAGTTVEAGASVSVVASDGSLAEDPAATSSPATSAPAGAEEQAPTSAPAAPTEEPAGGDAGAAGNAARNALGAGTAGGGGGLEADITQRVQEALQGLPGNGRGPSGGGAGRGGGARGED